MASISQVVKHSAEFLKEEPHLAVWQKNWSLNLISKGFLPSHISVHHINQNVQGWLILRLFLTLVACFCLLTPPAAWVLPQTIKLTVSVHLVIWCDGRSAFTSIFHSHRTHFWITPPVTDIWKQHIKHKLMLQTYACFPGRLQSYACLAPLDTKSNKWSFPQISLMWKLLSVEFQSVT